jgi:hypothetical protein
LSNILFCEIIKFYTLSQRQPILHLLFTIKTKSPLKIERAFLLNLIRQLPTLPHLKDAVPLALAGLTSVFEMGTGVTLPIKSPENW